MMKKLPLLLTAASLFLATGCTQKITEFTLYGTIAGYEGDVIYLRYGSLQDHLTFVDSAVVNNETFVFKGHVDQPYPAQLSATAEPDRRDLSVRFYIEPGKLKLTANWDAREDYTLIGSQTNDESRKVNEFLKPFRREMLDFEEKYAVENISAEERVELDRQMREIADKYQRVQISFIEENPWSYIAAAWLRNMKAIFNNDMEEYQRLYNNLGEKIKNSVDGKGIAESIAIWEGVQSGKPAPEITGTDINGNPFRLSDLRGKVVVLDFWASWCAPCRADNPHLMKLWNKYNSKGFEIVAIGDNDNSPDKWKEAIEQDGTGMFYHLLRGLKQPSAGVFDRSECRTKAYNVNFLPTKYLINADGNIIGMMRSKEELENKLQEMFGF
jgi:thiol-disulfide isomerase/thioredoxin